MSDETPDPSEVETLSRDEGVFQRDADGELLPQEKVIEYDGKHRAIEIVPTPKGRALEFENEFGGREEIDPEDVDAIVAEKVATPDYDIEDLDDMDPKLYFTLVDAVLEDLLGDDDDAFIDEVQEMQEERIEEGN